MKTRLASSSLGHILFPNFQINFLEYSYNFSILVLIFSYCNPQRPLENLNTLFPLLDKHCPSIKAIVNWCLDGETTQNKLPPKPVRPLLMSLAKPSPVCALVPPKDEMRLLLDEMKKNDIKQNPVMLQSLQCALSCSIWLRTSSGEKAPFQNLFIH